MFRAILIAASAVGFLSIPALAATSSNYWVAQNPTTHKCEVVSHRPDGKAMMEVGNSSYTTAAKATSAMKTATACK